MVFYKNEKVEPDEMKRDGVHGRGERSSAGVVRPVGKITCVDDSDYDVVSCTFYDQNHDEIEGDRTQPPLVDVETDELALMNGVEVGDLTGFDLNSDTFVWFFEDDVECTMDHTPHGLSFRCESFD